VARKDPTRVKDPVFVEFGKAASRARWGVPRRARLDELSDDERRLVLDMIAAMKAAQTSKDGQ